MDACIQVALEQVGCPSLVLKPEQVECINNISEGKDVFLWLPTGFGKSLCYELLPFVFDYRYGKRNSAVIVISPLISLMVDQVSSLRSRSVRAAIISSGGKVGKELLATKSDFDNSHFLFCAPEALVVPKWREAIGDNEFSS